MLCSFFLLSTRNYLIKSLNTYMLLPIHERFGIFCIICVLEGVRVRAWVWVWAMKENTLILTQQSPTTRSLFPFLFPLQQAIETSNARFSSGVVALQASTNWTLMCPIHTERRSKLFRSSFKVSIVCPCVTTLYVMRQNFDTSSR
jgi:hypothetical protein